MGRKIGRADEQVHAADTSVCRDCCSNAQSARAPTRLRKPPGGPRAGWCCVEATDSGYRYANAVETNWLSQAA
jgi:hypothetical protein